MVVVGLLAVEFMIAVVAPPNPSRQVERMRAAERIGQSFDGRTKSQVVSDLQAQGQEVLPGLSREWPRIGAVRQQLPDGLYPLGNAGQVRIVECNEGGEYVFYRPTSSASTIPGGSWLPAARRYRAVGESFAARPLRAARSQPGLGLLRHVYPRTVNFGMAGTSSLSMLASFREYVEPLRPPLVLWIINPIPSIRGTS